MRFEAARIIRGILSLAGFSLPVSLLILSACGGGGGGGSGGGGLSPGPPPAPGGFVVSTFAGAGNPGADGTGAAARFNTPHGSVFDGINLYVADSGNNTIRKITISTGAVTTLAGQAGVAGAADGIGAAATFNAPAGITIDSTNTNLYVADSGNNKIRQVVIATGAVSSVTGVANAPVTAGSQDGVAATASFNQPLGITTDGSTLFVADAGNNKIRAVDITNGGVRSLTGPPNLAAGAGAQDGSAFFVTFNNPAGITIDSTKTVLYVADTNNNKIRQVTVFSGAGTSFTGPLNTPVATGDVEGPAEFASFNSPFDMVTDGTNLYVADSANNKIRQIVLATGAVSSLTGASGVPGTAGFADGAESSAAFSSPMGITIAGSSLYVADTGNNTMRQIGTFNGLVSTLAGSALGNTGANGAGAAARFKSPGGIVSDGINLYVADTGNHTIRKIVISTAQVTTLAGQSGVAGAAEGIGAAATFNQPSGIATDGANLYVTDSGNNKIRKVVIATGTVSSLTGTANTAVLAGAADGAAASATFSLPRGIAADGVNLYVADASNNKIRKVVIATGAVSSLTGAANTAVTAGAADGAATAASFNGPAGIATDGVNLYVADASNNKIRQVVIATGAVSSLTGAANTAVPTGAADGASATASFNGPAGIATNGVNLYVTDASNNKIRQVVTATGAVSSLTGAANAAGPAGYADGVFPGATFSHPYGITILGGVLFVTDQNNNTVRRIQ